MLVSHLELRHPQCVCNIKVWYKEVKTQLVYCMLIVLLIPKHRWEDDVKSDVANMRIAKWKDHIRNRPKWKEFIEKAKTSLKL